MDSLPYEEGGEVRPHNDPSSPGAGGQPADPRISGLLEEPALRIALADGIVRATCGTVVGRITRRPFTFLRGGPIWEAVEAFEEPLVFRVRRSGWWRPEDEVLDADGERVGLIRGDTILDAYDHLFRRVARLGDGGEVRDLSGLVVSSWSREGDEVRVRFGDAVRGEPLEAMLVLAAVVACEM